MEIKPLPHKGHLRLPHDPKKIIWFCLEIGVVKIVEESDVQHSEVVRSLGARRTSRGKIKRTRARLFWGVVWCGVV